MIKQHILASAFVLFACVSTADLMAQDVLDLSGTWEFQTDRRDAGTAEKWYNGKLEDHILLPGSMPQRLKGDLPSVETQWTGSLYDSSYFYNPYMEKYRQELQAAVFPHSRPALCRNGLV